ncbi:hypothetical protein L6452_16324 [Arctium lappa]|uniref:Uncharacterized protein n=1 Tax=Arctium lappa TaxID=4217 RepID=A0ACB9C0B7_ARCLA|nr:hypothetical protein L6452_16324 [Arctium lappa]
MTKFRWNESMNMFRDHVDPEKEEQLKWIIIETDTKVKRISKLVKGLNFGNREAVQKKRSEVVYLIEDIHKQYQSLYALYEDLREIVKRKCNNEEDKEDCESSSSSLSYSLSMESAAFYSPSSGSKTPSYDHPKVTITDGQSMKSEISCYSLEYTSEVVKEALSVESVSRSYKGEEREEDERGRTVEDLMKETGYLRDRLEEKEKKYQNLENKSSAKLKELEDKIVALNLELEALNHQNGEHEDDQSNSRNDEVNKTSAENSEFQSWVSELELAFKEKEGEVLKKMDECEKIFKEKIDEYMGRLHNLQKEVEYLQAQNEARKKISYEKEKELESLRIQNQESEMELKKKTKEAADSLELLESLTEKLNQKTTNEEGLVEERDSLQRRVKDLEVMIVSIHDEAHLSKHENEKQKTTISQLEEKLQQKEDQITTLESKIEGVKKELSNKMKSLEQKFKSSESDKRELEGKNDVLVATLEQKDVLVNKLNHNARSSFQTSMKKMSEMVDEFRNKSEDSIRILSQRIRVAEQLHNETKDWYKKTKDKYEQDRIDNELAFRSIKLVMATVSDTLNVSETLGLRFVDCCEDFMNRVSKVSCEINFVKDWVKRKNSAMVEVKENVETLTIQLDSKEEEILGSREKVLKLENKLRELEKTVRELEKTVKENDETMMGLKEEKREAIRQLCVWIDYHRSRSDFLKRALSELITRNQRPT